LLRRWSARYDGNLVRRSAVVLGYGCLAWVLCGGCRIGYDEITAGNLRPGAAGDFYQGTAGDLQVVAGGSGSGGNSFVPTDGSAAASGGSSTLPADGSSGTSGGSGGSGAAGTASGMGGTGSIGDASSLGDCRSGTYATQSYLFCFVRVSWTTARDNCASIGLRLVRVDTVGENQYLLANTDGTAGYWLGASDSAVEGEWRWVDGDLFWLGEKNGTAQNGLYNGWYVGAQPTAQQPDRDCAVLDTNPAGGWFDSDCGFLKAYVCESP